jgi:nuclear transport factor 2 (NTF2) superfamily protein
MMTVRFNTVDVDGLKVSTPWRSQKLGVYTRDSRWRNRVDADGLMAARFASINEHPIAEAERHFRWSPSRRPDDHPHPKGTPP